MPGLHENKFKLIFVNSEILRRVETILYGPHTGAFCQIMDIFYEWIWKIEY